MDGIDIGTIKSAEIITDPEEISLRLMDADEKQTKRSGAGRQTTVTLCDDGRAKIMKRSSAGIVLPSASKAQGPSPAVPDTAGLEALVMARGIPTDAVDLSRVVPYWASDERVDGHGDIVKQAWHFDEFEKNSPMPYSHEWDRPPIGRHIGWEVAARKDGDYSGPALWLLALFAKAGDFEWADSIYRLVKSGILVGGSVGFYSTKLIDVKDDEERAKLGLGRWGYILDENHLLEFSPTTIGANAGAVAILPEAKQRGLEAADVQVLREIYRQDVAKGSRSSQEWEEIDGKLRGAASTLFPGARFNRHKSLDEPIVEVKAETPEPSIPAEPEPETVEVRLSRMEAQLQEIASGHGTILADVREGVEALQAALQRQGKTSDPEGPDAEPEGGDGKDESEPDAVDEVTRNLIAALEARQQRNGVE